MDRIAKRYAHALIEIAQTKNTLSDYDQQLNDCVAMVANNKRLYQIFDNPVNSTVIKNNLLQDLLGNHVATDILNLIKLLVKKKKLDLLNDVSAVYHDEMLKYLKHLEVVALSALPLSSDEIQLIKSNLKIKYHIEKIDVICKIDHTLLGGVKLVIKNEVMDNSVKGLLQSMQKHVLSR